ncbi:MAG TPA: hypothetical protein VF635_02170 [Propionibacteriaceae bacterium]|jgi:hypothetical protein
MFSSLIFLLAASPLRFAPILVWPLLAVGIIALMIYLLRHKKRAE